MMLASMPWRMADCPNIALGLLKPLVRRADVECDLLEAGLLAALAAPKKLYETVGGDCAGELAFAPLVYDDVSEAHAREQLRSRFAALRAVQIDAGDAVDIARDLIERLVNQIDWCRYDAVGFSLSFQQTLASAALARRIKEIAPDVQIVIGGAACEAPMGTALLEQFPFFDYAVSGRAEGVIAGVVEAMLGRRCPSTVPGLSYRDHNSVRATPNDGPGVPMDELPVPDYDDYFETRRALGLPRAGVRFLLETSIGCWWGQKHLCSFCGLNQTSLAYRQKSAARVLAEIEQLSQRYDIDTFEIVDNILPMSFFDDLLPALAESDRTFQFFAEVKSNLRKQQMELLARAGFRFLQPGIESFDDHILQLMDKGCTGIGQVEFVKWSDELKIRSAYGLLTANPGETVADYERMTEWIPSIVHLTPPYADPFDIQLVRFSPYFERQEEFGIRDSRPAEVFRAMFPDAPPDRLERMVFMFDFDHDQLEAPELVAARERFRRAVAHWRKVYEPAMLTYRRGHGWMRITDVRQSVWDGSRKRVRRYLLRGWQADLYELCDRALPRATLLRSAGVPPEEVESFLDQMIRARLMIDDGNKCLALALCAPRLDLRAPEPSAPLVEDERWRPVWDATLWEVDMKPARASKTGGRLTVLT